MSEREMITNEAQQEIIQDFYNVLTLSLLRVECKRHGNDFAETIFDAWIHRQQSMINEIPAGIGRDAAQRILDDTINLLDDVLGNLLK